MFNKVMLKQISNTFCTFLVNFLSTDSINVFVMGKDNRTIVSQCCRRDSNIC